MKRQNKYLYEFNNLNDYTSSIAQNNFVVESMKNNRSSWESNFSKYYLATSDNLNVFSKVIMSFNEIENVEIQKKLLLFINEFMMIINKVSGSNNVFPPFLMNYEEDSLFLEWVFKDFRVGFTFCEDDRESMWFLVSNRNLEELSVSGDLYPARYQEIILKILDFAFRNT